MFVLAWWFDWLPHHGLEDTQQREPLPRDPQPGRAGVAVHPADALAELPPGAPPAPVGPVLPLCGDLAAQRGGLPRARRRDLAPSSASSSTRTSSASGRSSTASCAGCCRCGCRRGRAPRTRCSTGIPVASVDPITEDSTLVTLRRARGAARRVPLRARPARHGAHRPRRRGRAAQLLDLRAGDPRSAADRGQAHPRRRVLDASWPSELKAGDVLELMTPTGQFGTPLHPLQRQALRGDRRRQRDHAGPVDAADDAGDRDREPLHADLRQPHQGVDDVPPRARPSSSPATPTGSRSCTSCPATRAHPRVARPDRRARSSRRGWPSEPRARDRRRVVPVRADRAGDHCARDTLIEHGVDAEHIHLELFFGYDKSASADSAITRPRPSRSRFPGSEETVDLAPGDSILEAHCRSAATPPTRAWAAPAAPAGRKLRRRAPSRWTRTSRSAAPTSTRATS